MERKLLLVDDEPNILSALTRLLRKDGYRITRASSAAEGLALLEEEEYGVILSDQRMPEMTGVEFLQAAKQLHPHSIRIVLSGYTDLNCVTDAINKGAIYRFLTKPWDDELLRKNIAEAFEHYEMRELNRQLTTQLQQANEELEALNNSLEQRIKEKTRALRINLRALQVSQDVLNRAPVAILGVSAEHIIVTANAPAHAILAPEQGGLIGEPITAFLPADALRPAKGSRSTTCALGGNGSHHKRCRIISTEIDPNAKSRGYVVALIADDDHGVDTDFKAP